MILITGADGFIGQYVCKDLLAHRYEIVRIGRTVGMKNWMNTGRVHQAAFDISNSKSFGILPLRNVEAVIHCAAALMIDGLSAKVYFEVNAVGTFNVLEYCREAGAKMIFLMTHSDTNAIDELYLDESSERIFKTSSYKDGENSVPFIASKIAAAEMIRSYARDGVVNATILRIANVRGYGSKDTKYNSVFHQFIAKARNSEPIELWGALKTQRDLIYVKDVARAVRLAMVKAPSGLYNIGSGKGMTIEDEAREIVKVFSPLDNPSKFVYRKEIPEVRKHSCIFRIDKARQHFGWAPIYSYHDGLVDMKHEQEGSYACK